MPETLAEICEPLFQYCCRLNRLARKGGLVDAGQVRTELKSIFADMKLKGDAAAGMAELFARVRPPLLFFADAMVRDSALSFARSWKPLAEEEKLTDPDQRFFQMLDETLADPSDSATQRLAIYYECVGLGYTGMYSGRPDVLKRKMLEMAARIRSQMDADEAAKICPETYEKVDERQLQLPVASGVVTWVIVLVGMVVALVAGSWVGYSGAVAKLSNGKDGSLDKIIQTSSEPRQVK